MPAGSSDPWVGFGPNPPLPKPQSALIPTIGTPTVVGWAEGAAPKAPAGFTVTRYAEGLDHPRWLYVLPNGDVLVSESASEVSPADKDNQGIRGFVQRHIMASVGSAKPSPNKIFLLRDADGDGVAETRITFAQGLTRPFGMTLVGSTLYVANDNGVVSFPYAPGQTSETRSGQQVFDLPGPPVHHHGTKNAVARARRDQLGHRRLQLERRRQRPGRREGPRGDLGNDIASRRTGSCLGHPQPQRHRFRARHPCHVDQSNERDRSVTTLPPDFLTSAKGRALRRRGATGATRRRAPSPPSGDGRQSHRAGSRHGPAHRPAGPVFYQASLPDEYREGAIGQHGSWNRRR